MPKSNQESLWLPAIYHGHVGIIIRSCFEADDGADVEKQVDNLAADSSASVALDSTVEPQKAEHIGIGSEIGTEHPTEEDPCGTPTVSNKTNNTDEDSAVEGKESTSCCSMA